MSCKFCQQPVHEKKFSFYCDSCAVSIYHNRLINVFYVRIHNVNYELLINYSQKKTYLIKNPHYNIVATINQVMEVSPFNVKEKIKSILLLM